MTSCTPRCYHSKQRSKTCLSGTKSLGRHAEQGISGLVVEYIVAIDVTRARFPADASKTFLGSPAGSQNELRPLRFASHSGRTHTLRTEKHILGSPTGSQNELRPLRFASHSGKAHTLRAKKHIFGSPVGLQNELRPLRFSSHPEKNTRCANKKHI